MTCPVCQLESVSSAQYCDCGHEFVPGAKPDDFIPVQMPVWYTSKHFFQCWAAWIVVPLALCLLSFIVPSSMAVGLRLGILLLVWGLFEPSRLYGFLASMGGSFLLGTVSFIVLGMIRRKR